MRCVASAHYFATLTDSYPDIDARVASVTRERYRRIDRFVQLALLGAANCARGRELDSRCGLYLSSGFGPINSNVLVQDAIHRDARLPMPFNFVNTLGSSACYHVVKEPNLSGEAVMLSSGGASFSAALASANADLRSGVATQVLVGAVEECVLPIERHRSLLRLPSDASVGEGSHWLLLESDDRKGSPVAESAFMGAEFDGYESADAARITQFVLNNSAAEFGIHIDSANRPQLLQY